jgi:hypothetical protein
MKFAFFFIVILFPISLVAQELPIANHVDVCGDGSIEMSDEELSEMLACTLEQRDAMGYLMDRWAKYPAELKEICLGQASNDKVDNYVKLKACLVQ